MIKTKDLTCIENLLNNKIIERKILSNSFGINCIKIMTDENRAYIVKYYNNKNKGFNAIKSEAENLIFLKELNFEFFPLVHFNNEDFLIMTFLENDKDIPNETNFDLLKAIIAIHSVTSDNFGLEFDSQIGGLKQNNTKDKNWINFYREQRLFYIFDLINKSNPMEKSINQKIELLLKKLQDYIPRSPKVSLLHGDLWEGNILFKNKNFVGLIDPGSFFGHNELEIAYLTWFNPKFVKNGFLDKYNDIIKIDKYFVNYEAIYQLYYSLLNVHLWDRSYINDVQRLLNKIKI